MIKRTIKIYLYEKVINNIFYSYNKTISASFYSIHLKKKLSNMEKIFIVKDSEIFEIAKKHSFRNSIGLIEEIALMFEEKFNFNFNRPINHYINKALKNKSAQIIKNWNNKNGGKQRKRFMETLEMSYFEIKVKIEDLAYQAQQYDNNDLIKDLRTKNSRVKSELFKAKNKINKLKTLSVKRKNFFHCSKRNQERIRTLLKTNLSRYVQSFGLKIENINLIKSIPLNENDCKQFNFTVSENENKVTSVKNILALKDVTNISDQSYSLVKRCGAQNWPSIHYLRQERKILNHEFSIELQLNGAYTSIHAKLIRIIQRNSDRFDSIEKLMLRIGADGTNVGMNLKLLNITFTIINIEETAKSSKGHYLIGLYELSKENYENLEFGECFTKLNEEIENLSNIIINGKTVLIEFFMGSDWKMLSNQLGSKGPTSNYPCLWCHCPKSNFWDISQDWSITNVEQGARIHESNSKTLITKNITISKYVPDMMHCNFRIFDKLMELLIENIQTLDEIIHMNAKTFCISKYKRLESLENFIKNDCKIKNFKFWIANNEITFKSLNGNERVKIHSCIQLKNIISDHPKVEIIQKIWDDFNQIQSSVKKKKLLPNSIKDKTKEWLICFLDVYQKTNVTPYMHMFVFHLHEFVELYGDIDLFTCQGLEKLNDLMKAYWFRSNNKKENVLVQLMEKRNRIEFNDLSLSLDKTAFDSSIVTDTGKKCSTTNIKDSSIIPSVREKRSNNQAKVLLSNDNYNSKYNSLPTTSQAVSSKMIDKNNQNEKAKKAKKMSADNKISSNDSIQVIERVQRTSPFRSIVKYDEWLIKNEWLTNGHINAYQMLIYDKFKKKGFEGFIHPAKFESISNDFYLNPQTIHQQPFVTVLNAGKTHWITLTNYNIFFSARNKSLGIWFIYDSLNNPEYYLDTIKPALKRLNISSIIKVMACDMVKQSGSSDCGLFALGYAIAICESKDPSKLVFKQNLMRNHFNEVLQSKILKQFEYEEIENTNKTNYKEYSLDLKDVETNF